MAMGRVADPKFGVRSRVQWQAMPTPKGVKRVCATRVPPILFTSRGSRQDNKKTGLTGQEGK